MRVFVLTFIGIVLSSSSFAGNEKHLYTGINEKGQACTAEIGSVSYAEGVGYINLNGHDGTTAWLFAKDDACYKAPVVTGAATTYYFFLYYGFELFTVEATTTLNHLGTVGSVQFKYATCDRSTGTWSLIDLSQSSNKYDFSCGNLREKVPDSKPQLKQ